MSEPSSWGSSSEWEDTEGWCCGSGTRNRNYPSPDSHQSGGGSKGSFTIFDNEASMIFEYFWAMPKMTTHRIPMFIFSILVRVSSAAERYKCYKDQALSKSKFSGEKSNIIRRLWHECFTTNTYLKESKQPIDSCWGHGGWKSFRCGTAPLWGWQEQTIKNVENRNIQGT